MISASDYAREVEEEEIAAMEMLLGARWIPPTGRHFSMPGYFLKRVKGEAGGLPVHWDVYYDRQGQEIDNPMGELRKAMGVKD